MSRNGALKRSALAAGLAATFLVGLVALRASRSTVFEPRVTELLLPWYEVSSIGDGVSPESVSVWSIPPIVSTAGGQEVRFPSAAKGAVAPVSSWNPDTSLNGGNKEWAEEDAALHAYNMENWRNKILEAQAHRQKMQWRLLSAKPKATKVSVTPFANKRGGGRKPRSSKKRDLDSDESQLLGVEREMVAEFREKLGQAEGSQVRSSGGGDVQRGAGQDEEDTRSELRRIMARLRAQEGQRERRSSHADDDDR